MNDHIEYANGLRLLADWFEAHQDVELLPTKLTIYPEETKENAARTLRALSPCAKEYRDELFSLTRKFGVITLDYCFYRKTVCVARVVGTKEVPETVVPERIEPAKVVPAHTVDIVEWDCKPVLGEDAQPPAVEQQEAEEVIF